MILKVQHQSLIFERKNHFFIVHKNLSFIFKQSIVLHSALFHYNYCGHANVEHHPVFYILCPRQWRAIQAKRIYFWNCSEIKKTHSLQFTKTINNGICFNGNDDRLAEGKKCRENERQHEWIERLRVRNHFGHNCRRGFV